MTNISHVLRAVFSRPWFILRDHLPAIAAILESRAAAGTLYLAPVAGKTAMPDAEVSDDSPSATSERAAAAGSRNTGGAVAIIPLYGCITHRGGGYYWGFGTTVEGFTRQFRTAVDDSSVAAIVVDVDSPGGEVDGVPELAAEIFKARGKKPIIAVANSMAASAAYYIASACSEVVASPSSLVGSVGVYTLHADYSEMLAKEGVKITIIKAGEHKAEANSYEPLDPAAEAALQEMVDDCYKDFVSAVARGRGVKVADVEKNYGQGRVLSPQNALKAGMVDSIGTLDSVLARFGVVRPTSGLRGAATADEKHTASVPEGQILSAAADDAEPTDRDDTGDPADCECPCDACAGGDHSDCDIDECPTPEACGHGSLEATDAQAENVQREREAAARSIALAEAES